MPIRPENRARYPADWPTIARAVKERAGWRCEGSPDFPDCRVPHGAIGYRGDADAWVQVTTGDRQALAEAQYGFGDLVRLIRIVLTVAHLDHHPENCEPENLRAWCQRCHLHYDRHHHAATAARTRREGRAIGDLLDQLP